MGGILTTSKSSVELIAKNLLEKKFCDTCHYCVRASLLREDWNCRNKIRNKALYRDEYVRSPKEGTCEDWFENSGGATNKIMEKVIENQKKLVAKYGL
jgi:hypothetical protein